MKRRWTEEEVTFLSFAYTSSEFEMEEICEALDRSEQAVRNKLCRLRILLPEKQVPEKQVEGYKKCIKCGVEKKRSEFYKKTKNKDGYKSECKKCEDDRRKEWRIKKSREMGRVWY